MPSIKGKSHEILPNGRNHILLDRWPNYNHAYSTFIKCINGSEIRSDLYTIPLNKENEK